jgi:NTP pyrophosphatase (non-canonical NTP hydrolase)
MFRELGKQIARINEANGWDRITPQDWGEKYKIPALLDLIHSEISEATEGFRHDDLENFREELADAVIRILSLCEGLGIDLHAAVTAKIEKNRARGYHHGGKRI